MIDGKNLFNLTYYLLEDKKKYYKEKPILIYLSGEIRKEYSYEEFIGNVVHISEIIKNLSFSKERILIRMANSPKYIFAFLGIVLSGNIAVPLSPQLTEDEVSFIISDCEAGFLLRSPIFSHETYSIPDLIPESNASVPLEKIPFPSDTSPETPAYLVYTSGTTGYPKGVLHPQKSILGRLPMKDGWNGMNPKDKTLHPGQMNWTYTMGVGMTDPILAGATAVLTDSAFSPEVLVDILKKERITIFSTVPALYRRLIKYGDFSGFPSSLRHCLSAGESLSTNLRDTWKSLTGVEIYEALGMSEISTYLSTSPFIPYKENSPGKIQKGRNIKLLPRDGGLDECKPGEIGILSVHKDEPGLFLRYWKSEKEPLPFRDSYFLTGDLAHRDLDGYLFYHGRNDDILNASGYRISPLEIERLIRHHEFVHDVGVTSIDTGQNYHILVAFLIAEPGLEDETSLISNLRTYLTQHLAGYKIPKEFILVKELPFNRNGKLSRKDLQKLFPPHRNIIQ